MTQNAQHRKSVWYPYISFVWIHSFLFDLFFAHFACICWLDSRCGYLHLGMCLPSHIEMVEESSGKRRKIEFGWISATFTDGKFSQFLLTFICVCVCASRNDTALVWNRFASLVTLYSISPVYSVIRNQNPSVSNFNFHELKYLKIKEEKKRTYTNRYRECAYRKERFVKHSW